MSFWDEIEVRVTEAEATDRPDPWAAHADPPGVEPTLTDEQREFLVTLADQPAVPRLAGELEQEQPGSPTG